MDVEGGDWGVYRNFDVDLLTPKVVQTRLVYMSPEWKEAFRYAAGLAGDHGLELAISVVAGLERKPAARGSLPRTR